MLATGLGVDARSGEIPLTYLASGGGTINSDPAFSTPGFTGTITVTPTSGVGSGSAVLVPTGGLVSPITIATFTERTTAVGPGQVVYYDTNVTVPVQITDLASGQHGTITETLSFLGFGASNFPALSPTLSVKPSTLDLGKYVYQVYYEATTSTGSESGSIQMGLEATQLASVPEPCSLALVTTVTGPLMALALASHRLRRNSPSCQQGTRYRFGHQLVG